MIAGMPKKVEILEVGPRDGFQNISRWIPTEDKIAIIDALLDSGVKRIEVTSFVNPKAVPQMADAADIMKALAGKPKRASYAALVPNLLGARKAMEAGVDELTYVVSASVRHNLENTRQTHEQSMDAFRAVSQEKGKTKIKFIVATVFGCPFDGEVPVGETLKLIEQALAAGADDLALADTIGVANPVQIITVLSEIKQHYPDVNFGLHLHDTRGMGLANTYAAMTIGYNRFETAVGGLGGCPFAPGAAGNIATEDMVNMMMAMRVTVDVSLEGVLKAAALTAEKLDNPLISSHMFKVKGCTGK